MKNDKSTYFVENIISQFEENDKESNKVTLVLLKASEKSNLLSSENNLDFFLFETTKEKINNVAEGKYIHYSENEITNASNTSIARRHVYYNNFYRGRLLKNQIQNGEETLLNKNAKIYSYHVNVGHGNCGIIVIRDTYSIKIWMIDCSDYDYKNKSNYFCNIDACFKHISTKFKLNEIKIDKFFLTHFHFDHYSGIERLIRLEKITSKTEFYMNLHYCMPSETYNRLLRKINILKPTIIEPISTFTTKNIVIWHPHNTTIRSMTLKYSAYNAQVEKHPNNSSVVYSFRFGDKSILFPGDLETEKWNTITAIQHL